MTGPTGTELKASQSRRVEVFPMKVSEPATVETCKDVPIGRYLLNALSGNGLDVQDRDIVVVTSKLVSIFEGRTVRMDTVKPSVRSRIIGWFFRKDPRKIELLLSEGPVGLVVPLNRIGRIPAMWAQLSACAEDPGTLERMYRDYSAAFMVRVHGTILDDAGIDASNTPKRIVSMLPVDPCGSAKRIRDEIRSLTGREVAVVITDTASVLGRIGGQDVALGFSGIDPLGRHYAAPDVFGNPKMGGLELIVDPIAAMAGLVMGQTSEATPVCLFRGYPYQPERQEAAVGLITYPKSVMFRSVALTVFSTIGYHIVSFLTLPFGRSRKKHHAN